MERFVAEFVRDTPTTAREIVGVATLKPKRDGGLAVRQAETFIAMAEQRGLIFRHSFQARGDNKAYYATRPPELFTGAQGGVSLSNTNPPHPPDGQQVPSGAGAIAHTPTPTRQTRPRVGGRARQGGQP